MRTLISELDTEITVYDRKYKLQHPGTREWLKLKQKMRRIDASNKSVSVELDTVLVLDYFFEHCCFPEVGEKLSIDTVSPKDCEEVWEPVSLLFLRGELGNEFKFPEK